MSYQQMEASRQRKGTSAARLCRVAVVVCVQYMKRAENLEGSLAPADSEPRGMRGKHQWSRSVAAEMVERAAQ